MDKSRSQEIIDAHINALEEELEWYQAKNIEFQKLVEVKHNALLEYDNQWNELVEQHKKVKAVNKQLREQLATQDQQSCTHVQGNVVIAQLEEENARLRDQLRWRPVSELPKRMSLSCMNDLSENVILRRNIGHDIIAYYSYWKKCWQDLYTHESVSIMDSDKWCYIPEGSE